MIVGMLINKAYDFMVHISQFIDIKNFENALIIIATFYIAMLAFMIPVSIQMIRNIRQDFPTKYTDRKFRNSTPYKYLHLLLISQIFIISILCFFIKDFDALYLLIIFAVILIFMFITSCLIIAYIKRLMVFVNKEKLLTLLAKDTDKYLKATKQKQSTIKTTCVNFKKKIRVLFKLTCKANKENDNIEVGLNAFADILEKEINGSPDQNYISAILKNIEKYANEFLTNNESTEHFKIISNGIEKAAKKAILIENDDITEKINDIIDLIITNIISKNNNNVYLEALFEQHYKITKFAIGKNNNKVSLFAYYWYFNFVFDRFNKRDVLKLEYLDTFDKYQFEYITIIINENKFQIFENYISWLHDGISHYVNVNLYSYFTNDDFLIAKELKKDFESLHNVNKLREVKEKIKQNKLKIKASTDKTNLYDELIHKAHKQFCFNNIKEMVLGATYYCLYNERYEFIKCIWTYKQPLECNGTWCGRDIYPKSINEVITMIWKECNYNEDKFVIREQHKNSIYFKPRYRIYLIAYLIYNDKKQDERICNISKFYSLREIDNIKCCIKKLQEIVKDVIKTESLNIFQRLGFYDISEEKIKELQGKVTKLLDQLIERCKQTNVDKIIEAEISENKVNGFNKSILDQISENTQSIDNMIKKDFGKYIQSKHYDKKQEKIPKLSYSSYLPKDIFTKNSEIGYHNLTHSIAWGMIKGKNNNILKKIKKECKRKPLEDFGKILTNIADPKDLFILTINNPNLFFNNKFFEAKDKSAVKPDLYDLQSFEGYLLLNDVTNIPVFSYFDKTKIKSTLILNKEEFITYIQYKVDDENKNIYDDFYIDIKQIDEHEINEAIEKQNKNNAQENEELKKKMQQNVIFDIYEHYETKFPNNFEGYIFDVDDSELSF